MTGTEITPEPEPDEASGVVAPGIWVVPRVATTRPRDGIRISVE